MNIQFASLFIAGLLSFSFIEYISGQDEFVSINQENFYGENMTKYTVVEKTSMTIIGIECRTSNSPEAAPQDIPKHWEKFYHENSIDKIPNKISNEVIALYCDYEGDYTKPYSLVIGCAVESLDLVPEGMVFKIIPAGHFAVFKAIGQHPDALIEAWRDVWKETNFKRTYSGDYEFYGDNFFSRSPQEVDVFIAIEQKIGNVE